jgi:hypothetical protein
MFLRNPRASVQPWSCPTVFQELLMSVTFAKMHKAFISARLTFTSWNPSAVLPTAEGSFRIKTDTCTFYEGATTSMHVHTHILRG